MTDITIYSIIAGVLTFLLATPIMVKVLNSKYKKTMDAFIDILSEARQALSDGALTEEEVKAVKYRIDNFIATFKDAKKDN